MKLIVNPIYIFPDGRMTGRQYDNAAILCLDADKLDSSELHSGLEHWRLQSAIDSLMECGNPASSQDVKNHLLPESFAEYKTFLDLNAHTALATNVQNYIEHQRRTIAENPGEFFSYLGKRIAEEGITNAQYNFPSYMLPPNEKTAARHRNVLNQALGKLPDYLKTLLENEEVLLICERTGLGKGFCCYNQKAVIISRMLVDYGNPEWLAPILKEEFLHYYDDLLGISKRGIFRHAANEVKNNPEQLARILQQLNIAHSQVGKTPISQYKAEDFYAELLVEYFHLRDYLRQSQQYGAESFAAKARPDLHPDAVDEKMIEIFGATLHRECKDFEEKLISRAAEISPARLFKY